ncbi:MAG: phage holin family protein [Chthoniobacterales bacterium]
MSSQGIPARLMGLSSALLQHVVAILLLAGLEARQLLKRSIASILIFIAILIFIFIGYLALLSTVIAIAIMHFSVSFPLTLAGVALFHFFIAGILILFLRRQQNEPAFAVTLHEIQRDIELLATDSRDS